MIDLRWHGAARAEAVAAAAFYKGKRPGLAQHLLHNVEDTLRRLQRQPRTYPRLEGEMHKCRVPHFPYGIIYRVCDAHMEREPHIEILAFMHLRNPPGYRKERGPR